jgi:uncharacterized protein (TIGR03083 family)
MDLRELDRRALDVNLDLIATIEPAQYGLTTPCDRWTIGDLLQHLIDATYNFAGGGEGDYRAAADAVTRTFTRDGFLDEVSEFGRFGPMRGKVKVATHLVDTVVHAWDLNKALGRDSELDPELAAAALRIAERLPDAPGVRGPDAAFHERIPVPDNASLTDRLVAVCGRSPGWSY